MAAPDLLTTEVIAHRLHSTAEEMLATLVKTAYSPNIKERRDCSTAIFNAQGDALALGISSPIHFGSMLGMVDNLTRRYPPHELRPGEPHRVCRRPFCLSHAAMSDCSSMA